MESHARRIVAPLPAKPIAVRTAVLVVPLLAALLALLVFGVAGVAASTPAPNFDFKVRFRWT